VIERLAGSYLTTTDVYCLMAFMAQRLRVDGTHWDSTNHGGRPVGFLLDEKCLQRFEAKYNMTTRAVRRHLLLMAQAEVAHLCQDGGRHRDRAVTLIPTGSLAVPCPGCRRMSTDEVGRPNRRSSTVKATKLVGQERPKWGPDLQEGAVSVPKSQPSEDHEEGRTLSEEQEKEAFARAKAVLDPSGTEEIIAALEAELEGLRSLARSNPAAQARYLEASDELSMLEQARAS
jgi:hypothetical protein